MQRIIEGNVPGKSRLVLVQIARFLVRVVYGWAVVGGWAGFSRGRTRAPAQPGQKPSRFKDPPREVKRLKGE